MKIKPILFSTPMIQAIMEGRKTQTRRIINPQPSDEWMKNVHQNFGNSPMFKNGRQIFWISNDSNNKENKPLVEPGDIFWVRETWQHTKCLGLGWDDENYGYVFRADDQPWEDFEGWNWKPSIYMPREACRLFLKVIRLRVQRLLEISAVDAIEEGIIYYDCEITKSREFKDYVTKVDGYGHPDFDYPSVKSPRESFFSLWVSINGRKDLEANPWVWVYDFEITKKPTEWPVTQK